jgi:hypothetical protein
MNGMKEEGRRKKEEGIRRIPPFLQIPSAALLASVQGAQRSEALAERFSTLREATQGNDSLIAK